jgi:predicted DNA-binding transcriptional regulator AlpA
MTELDVVGLSEIGEMMGVSRQRADQLCRTKGFPDPCAVLRHGSIWYRPEVAKWITEVRDKRRNKK